MHSHYDLTKIDHSLMNNKQTNDNVRATVLKNLHERLQRLELANVGLAKSIEHEISRNNMLRTKLHNLDNSFVFDGVEAYVQISSLLGKY